MLRGIPRTGIHTTVMAPRCVSTASASLGWGEELGSTEEIEAANERYKGSFEIRKNQFGHGVFAATSFRKDTVLFTGNMIEVSEVQHTHTIQTSPTEHVVMDLPARFVNHRCGTTNVGTKVPKTNRYQDGGLGVYEFIAKQDIQANQELLWDYETTELEIENFSCACGADKCRHSLQGFRKHYESVLEDHGVEWVAPYLLESLPSNI